MNLFPSSGPKNVPEKDLKQILLNDQIQKLRQIYHESSQVLQKVISALKKLMNRSVGEIEKKDLFNYFYEDLSTLEDHFISMIEDAETDKQVYFNTTVFRSSEKYHELMFFRKAMKQHQKFKENLNKIIERLEKDIQYLQSNGFHIYDQNSKPNNIIGTLKKNHLDKYTIICTEANWIFNKFIQNNQNLFLKLQKKIIKLNYKNDCQKLKDYQRYCSLILLKEKIIKEFLVKKINALRQSISEKKKQLTKLKQAKQTIQFKIQINDAESNLFAANNISREKFKQLTVQRKKKADLIVLNSPFLYVQKSKRSYSCHPILTTRVLNNKIDVKQHSTNHSFAFQEKLSKLICQINDNEC